MSQGILSVDRYAAYRKFARQTPGVSLSICWAHQRRHFLRLANVHPAFRDWAMGWGEQIAQLCRLHALRREHYDRATDQAAFIASDVQLRELKGSMDIGCQSGVGDEQLVAPARKVLRTMRAYWAPGFGTKRFKCLICLVGPAKFVFGPPADATALQPGPPTDFPSPSMVVWA